jgi:hypothetical protein
MIIQNENIFYSDEIQEGMLVGLKNNKMIIGVKDEAEAQLRIFINNTPQAELDELNKMHDSYEDLLEQMPDHLRKSLDTLYNSLINQAEKSEKRAFMEGYKVGRG